MATDAEIKTLARALNGVASAGQAQAACGAASRAWGAAYPLLPQLRDDLEASLRSQLDEARVAVEDYYDGIKGVSPAAELRESFQQRGRKLIEKVYIVIAGIEGAANHKPQTSNLAILATSIAEAPAVFGAAVGTVTAQAGQVVGQTAGGLLSGLGISGTLTLAVVAAVILLVVTRGTILGRIAGGGA